MSTPAGPGAPAAPAAPPAPAGNGSSRLLARLEQELRDLWKPPEDPTAPPLTRVCTMNIEVIAPSSELLERYTPVIDEVTASIPARAILASIEPEGGADDITGSATAVCSLSGGKQICSERITLAVRGNASARAASAIDALRVPEIPTALVWLGRVHTDDPVFEVLAGEAHRIVLDSEYTSISSVIHVAAWARGQRNAPEIADLAWTRIAVWQEMLARFFDDLETRPLASKVTRLVLKQACDPGARIGPESALMLGWIGTRLGWKTSRLAGALRFKRADGAAVTIELAAVPRPSGVAPHTLAGFALEAGDDPKAPILKGSIERELASGLTDQVDTTRDADVIVWRCTKADGAEIAQRIRLGANKAAKWLERTLHRPLYDAAFAESIAFAEHIVEDGLTVA
ncbi:MAG: glucose-6-phosphate dehydrogenase assembly protein OpcA [Labilithrix sp.]|nr:glucose-6-phosphate dehydrogenase assembly protein OpcA [Labilithrix sp.]